MNAPTLLTQWAALTPEQRAPLEAYLAERGETSKAKVAWWRAMYLSDLALDGLDAGAAWLDRQRERDREWAQRKLERGREWAQREREREQERLDKRERARALWAPFPIPAAGAARVREIFALQEQRKHPGLWVSAPPYALRFRPKRATVPTLEIRLVTGRGDDGKRLASFEWKLDADEARCTGLAFIRGADATRDFAVIREHRRALLVAALETFGVDEQPFAGLAWCGICGRGLIDPDSIARGIGPECLEVVLGLHRNESATAAIFISRNREATP